MKRTAFVVMMLAILLCPAMRADEAVDRPWSVGYAEAEITPGVGRVQMSGFGRERCAKGSLAPLLTQTIALRDGDGRTGVLITADIAGFGRVMTEAIRRSITRKHGIPPENVILSAAHTHWGPATRFHATFAAGAPNVWYMGFLEDKILGNVDAALENLAPATVESIDRAPGRPTGELMAPEKTVDMVFSHIGIITHEKKPGERFVPATRVWVTDFQTHPQHVEWLRFELDSPTTGPVREMPHVAYEVNSIKAAAKGMKELLAPFDAGIAVVGFYQTDDGAIVEFMEMKK